MNNEIALHELTKKQLEQFIHQPSHALALIGLTGIGKTYVATWLVSRLSKMPVSKVAHQPYWRIISPEGQSISIDAVRELTQFLKLKTAGRATLRRFVVIEHAETLTLEAQNALLKLLEEPPADTLIILTLTSDRAVLPTIISRTQRVLIRRPSRLQLKSLVKPTDDFEQLYLLSGGLPGLLKAMHEQADNHPLITAINTAKGILSASKAGRLTLVDGLAKQKPELPDILEALERIAVVGLNAAAKQRNMNQLNRWQLILSQSYEAKVALIKGAQTKLLLTNLMLKL